MAYYYYGSAIKQDTHWRDGEKDTRTGKRYGVSLRKLERDRLILKEFYRLCDDESVSRRNVSSILAKQFGVTTWQIRNILKKMRGR